MKQLILCSAMACLCVNLSAMHPDENRNHDNPIRGTHVVSGEDTHQGTPDYLSNIEFSNADEAIRTLFQLQELRTQVVLFIERLDRRFHNTETNTQRNLQPQIHDEASAQKDTNMSY